MGEYKLLKDFGELVPGMIFENESGEEIHIVEMSRGYLIYKNEFDHSFIVSVNLVNRKLKLIHVPRTVQKKTIQEKISEHKLQIEILEKELENESLKSLLKIGSVYRVSDNSDRCYICKVLSLNNLSFNYMTTEDNTTRLLRYVEVKKIFKINSLEEMFKYIYPIYERGF